MSEKKFKVLGYIKPTSSFHTIEEWQKIANRLLYLQSKGMDTRSGEISCKNANFCNKKDYSEFIKILAKNFGYLLYSEVPKRELLTQKNVLDFIEDLVNHRIWGLEKEFENYFPDISKLRFAYFYSRGDLEPYVLLDEEYTEQIYGSSWNPKIVNHYTTPNGLKNLKESLESGQEYDISSFTYIEKPFFRKKSTICVTLIGNVRAAFRSDIKSFATDSGRRACNLYRLEYPGKNINNICFDLDRCDAERTNLWNEFIVTPVKIIEIK
tara:strand:- start:476 stop:1276 length:801 start_codon:yes stop_codon:yes gene_type:complete